jgi:VWFA-related protein
MTSRSFSAACGCLSAMLVLHTAHVQQSRFRSGVDLVEVAVVAIDDSAHVVSGLTREDFDLREDGRSVPLATFAEVGPPVDAAASRASDGRFVILLLDDFVSSPSRTANIKRIARMFAERMGPNDISAVVRTNGSATTTTTDRRRILAAIENFRPNPTDLGSIDGKRRHVLRTLVDLSRQLEPVQHRRKALVCIGASTIFEPTEEAGRAGRTYGPEWFDAPRPARQSERRPLYRRP